MLTVENLSVRYGSVNAVRDLTLTCSPGEVVALLGPNGAGKSTTLLAIAGALDAGSMSGAVSFAGQLLRGRTPEHISALGVALVPERRRIFASLSVRENLLVGASSWAGLREAERETGRVLERFPALATMKGRQAGLLSGGQQQQLAIARALMARPKILLLDEPSLGLAPQVVEDVFRIIDSLRDDGLGVLLVEQQVVQATELADRAYVMRKGVIEGQADRSRLDALVSHYLGVVN